MSTTLLIGMLCLVNGVLVVHAQNPYNNDHLVAYLFGKKMFDKPRMPKDASRYVNHCYGVSERPCGRLVANWWCQQKGYKFALKFKAGCKVKSIGSMNGQNWDCPGGGCGSFCWILCGQCEDPYMKQVHLSWTTHPADDGRIVNECYKENGPCGKPIADLYCQKLGHHFASYYQGRCPWRGHFKSLSGVNYDCTGSDWCATGFCHVLCEKCTGM